jgi:hypothetical protein
MLDNLPNDILRLIATHLSLLDVVTLFRTNKVINKALDNEIMGHQYFKIYNESIDGIQWYDSYNEIINYVPGNNWAHRFAAIKNGKIIDSWLCLGSLVADVSVFIYNTDTLLTLSERIGRAAILVNSLKRFQKMLVVENIYVSFDSTDRIDEVKQCFIDSLPMSESLGLNITNTESLPKVTLEKIFKENCGPVISKWSSVFENSNLFSAIKYIYICFSIEGC